MQQPLDSVNSYDQVPYPAYAFAQTHPRHLETLAALLSLAPPDSRCCRVLEIGCSDGGNLIPMAVADLQSEYVGIDASARQIETGQARIERLKLSNIQLIHGSVELIDSSWGQFDYIVCHGVFSWVAPVIQQSILRTIRERLTENGIAYISYNTHPGWHGRGVIRHMMQYHVERYPEDLPEQRITRARGLLEFLNRATTAQTSAYAQLLKENLQLLNRLSDAYLFHEHLEEHNQPFWFLDFCAQLGQHDLRYLAEADFSSMFATAEFSKEVQSELADLAPGLLEKEQYLDFLRNRSFRQTLICRSHLRPAYQIQAKQVFGLCVASNLKAAGSVDLASDEPQDFSTATGLTLTTSSVEFKAALCVLQAAWPQSLPFDELLQRSRSLLTGANAPCEEDHLRQQIAKSLLTTFSSVNRALVELVHHPASFQSSSAGACLGSCYARLQASEGNTVTNLRHETVALGELERQLLLQCNGCEAQTLIAQASAAQQHSASDIAQALENLAHRALLV